MPLKPAYVPADYAGVAVVDNTDDFYAAEFNPANCILHPRRLSGDFNGLAQALLKTKFMQPLPRLAVIIEREKNSAIGMAARFVQADILEHNRQAEASGGHVKMELRAEIWSKRELFTHANPNLHHDHSDNKRLGRVMCCYTDLVTECARNEDVYPSRGDYQLKPGKSVFSFRPGDLWRQAVTGGPVEPFIHRTPNKGKEGELRILFLGN